MCTCAHTFTHAHAHTHAQVVIFFLYLSSSTKETKVCAIFEKSIAANWGEPSGRVYSEVERFELANFTLRCHEVYPPTTDDMHPKSLELGFQLTGKKKINFMFSDSSGISINCGRSIDNSWLKVNRLWWCWRVWGPTVDVSWLPYETTAPPSLFISPHTPKSQRDSCTPALTNAVLVAKIGMQQSQELQQSGYIEVLFFYKSQGETAWSLTYLNVLHPVGQHSSRLNQFGVIVH